MRQREKLSLSRRSRFLKTELWKLSIQFLNSEVGSVWFQHFHRVPHNEINLIQSVCIRQITGVTVCTTHSYRHTHRHTAEMGQTRLYDVRPKKKVWQPSLNECRTSDKGCLLSHKYSIMRLPNTGVLHTKIITIRK